MVLSPLLLQSSKCVNASELVYHITLLFGRRLYVSLQICHDILIYPENAAEQKHLLMYSPCGATKCCRRIWHKTKIPPQLMV